MKCKKCLKEIVLNGFSNGKCINCGKVLITSVTPPDKLCIQCSNELNKCCRCGKEVE